MLEKNDDRYTYPLPKRLPERTLFVLLTPDIFRLNPLTRLYGHLMEEYRRPGSWDSERTLHRKDPIQLWNGKILQWEQVRSRLGWLTWKDR